MDAGTGLVHIAPGHGLDDYNLGRQNCLPIYSPVDDGGKLATTNDLPIDQQFGAELIGDERETKRLMAALELARAYEEQLAKLGVEEMIMKPEDFDARIAREVARELGYKVD
mgnify:CR=1 FL=1